MPHHRPVDGFVGRVVDGSGFAVGSALVGLLGRLLNGRSGGRGVGGGRLAGAALPSLGRSGTSGLGRIWVHPVGTREWYGPWPNRRYDEILAFARIGSQHGRQREVWAGDTQPARKVRVYRKGKRAWPSEVTTAQRRSQRRAFTGRARYGVSGTALGTIEQRAVDAIDLIEDALAHRDCVQGRAALIDAEGFVPLLRGHDRQAFRAALHALWRRLRAAC